jgi:hypothetical protein
MLKMMEGFVKRDRLDAMHAGKVTTVSLQEPWISVAEKQGYQWTLGWGRVPLGATHENTVDNRAWQ